MPQAFTLEKLSLFINYIICCLHCYRRVSFYIFIYIEQCYSVPWVWNTYSIPEPTHPTVPSCPVAGFSSARSKLGTARCGDRPAPPRHFPQAPALLQTRAIGQTPCLLPDFDFVAAAASPRFALPSGASDFDGSFPRAVARLVAAAGEAHSADWKHGAPANLPRALLVV